MSAGRPCTIVFRRTGHNHYSLNALVGLLDETFAVDAAPCAADAAPAAGGPVAAQTAGSLPELLRALADASAAGRRPVAAWSFSTAGLRAAGAEMAAVRAALPEALRLAGGPHASARPQETLAAGADHVFRGEAEASLPAFLRGLTAGGGRRGRRRRPDP